ncbi:DMT family transporter [Paenibacillus senegalensis]|uniref:DMT family transporter n=1 Tax=Paenibacillus senegalensis TaxID=1465766 RepID=UPI000287E490|nr:multidrug efflux SMR transporter [Paenibacillus senegalensis]
MAYLYLMLAIFLEVVAAIAARYTEGFTVALPTIITIGFAVASYFNFSLSLRYGMNIAIGYAVWSGVGVLAVALLGALWLEDTLTLIQIAGIVLIISGLAAVQLGGRTESAETTLDRNARQIIKR